MDRLDPRPTPYQSPDPASVGNPPDDTVARTPEPPAGRVGDAAVAGIPEATFDPWTYRDDSGVTGADLVGYKVEATDGGIGKIDHASQELSSSYLVVDTGPWIFGKKVMLPAGVVNHVDHDDRKVYVDRSKDQIKSAPEYDEDSSADPAYRDKLGSYYGETYGYGTPYGGPGSPLPPQNLV